MGDAGARGRRCPSCSRSWPQANARFCGSCGARLREPTSNDDHPAVRRLRLGVPVLVAVVVLAAVTDLSQRPPQTPVEVDVDDDVATAANPLSDDEVTQLRERSDPERLRCVPQGCERWRFERAMAPMAAGAVEIADGLVLVLLGEPPGTRPRNLPGTTGSGGEDPDPASPEEQGGEAQQQAEEQEPVGHRLVAIDPATGEARWTRPVRELPGVSGAYRWVRLLPGPDRGALVTSGTTVTAIDASGQVRWTATDSSPGRARDVWQATATERAVVLVGRLLDRSSATQHLTALHPDTGEVLWRTEVGQLVDVSEEQVVVVDRDGTLRALEAASGGTRWVRPGPVTEASAAGPWLAVQDGATLHLVEPTTGADVSEASGWLTSPLVEAGELWVGTLRQPGDRSDVPLWGDEAAAMRLAAFDADGLEMWSANLGSIRPWWDCCPIRTDRDGGTVTALGPRRDLHHDVETGELLDVDVVAGPRERTGEPRGLSAGTVRYAAPGVEVAVSEEGRRVDVQVDDRWATVRSGRGLTVESIDPLVITDGRELLGVTATSGDEE